MESSFPISQRGTCWQRLTGSSNVGLQATFSNNGEQLIKDLNQELTSSKPREATLDLACRIIACIPPEVSAQSIKNFFTILTVRNIWPDTTVFPRTLTPAEEKMILTAVEAVCRKNRSSLLPELVERVAHLSFQFHVHQWHSVSLALMETAAAYAEEAVIKHIRSFCHFTDEEVYKIAKIYLKSAHRNESTTPLSVEILNFSKLNSSQKNKLAVKACKTEPQALEQNIHRFCLTPHEQEKIKQKLKKTLSEGPS